MKCYVCKEAEVTDYKAEYCCTGWMCGCMGLPIEPPVCDDCWDKKFVKEK